MERPTCIFRESSSGAGHALVDLAGVAKLRIVEKSPTIISTTTTKASGFSRRSCMCFQVIISARGRCNSNDHGFSKAGALDILTRRTRNSLVRASRLTRHCLRGTKRSPIDLDKSKRWTPRGTFFTGKPSNGETGEAADISLKFEEESSS